MKKNIYSIFALGLVVMLSVFASCNKLSNRTTLVTPVTPPITTPDSVILKPGIIVIDSNQLTLVSSADQLAGGVYVYTSSNGFPAFITSDIIIGITGEGYLRKVTSVVTQAGQVTLSTTPAKLEDVFQQANINFTTDVSNLARKTGAEYQYSISNSTSLFQDGTASVALTGGTISINPNWNFNMQFQNGAMTGFSAICNNGTLNANVQMAVMSSGADNITGTKTLNPVSGRKIIWIGQLPIVVTTYLSFATTVSGNVDASINHMLGFTTSDNYTLGDTYTAGSWMNQYSYSHTSTMTDSVATGYNLSCSIAPQMTLKIYGVVCPSTSNALNTVETSGSTFAGGFTEQQMFSISGNILGYSVPDNSFTRNTDTVSYLQTGTTGSSFLKISGDGQIGAAYQYLAMPLIVRVVDNTGAGQAGVTVDFTVTGGGGLLSYYSVTTNSNGYAQTNWQIGDPATASQSVQAVAHTTGGVQIGSALNFIAL